MCLKFTDASQGNATAIFKVEDCSSEMAPHRITLLLYGYLWFQNNNNNENNR
jgi:hypothetical protein